jgi:hypothetical protein
MRAYREIRGIAPLILNFDTRWRWVVNFMSWEIYPLESTQVLTEWDDDWFPELVCLFWEKFLLPLSQLPLWR